MPGPKDGMVGYVAENAPYILCLAFCVENAPDRVWLFVPPSTLAQVTNGGEEEQPR